MSTKYTQKDERIAQRRLRDIYNKKNRRQRIALVEKFDYGGTDASKLRNLRRITAQVVPQGRQVKVNQYFRSFTTDDDPNPYRGKTPNYELDGLFHVVSSVMFVAEFPDGLTTFSNFINTSGEGSFSTDVRELFVKYGEDVVQKYKPVSEGGENLPESGRIVAISFSEKGALELAVGVPDDDIPPKIPGIAIPDPQGGEYGISLVPSRKGVRQGEKVPQVWAYEYQRPLPKAKRDRIIEYTNRAKGPMGVS
jgi:hypothetical protein